MKEGWHAPCVVNLSGYPVLAWAATQMTQMSQVLDFDCEGSKRSS